MEKAITRTTKDLSFDDSITDSNFDKNPDTGKYPSIGISVLYFRLMFHFIASHSILFRQHRIHFFCVLQR